MEDIGQTGDSRLENGTEVVLGKFRSRRGEISTIRSKLEQYGTLFRISGRSTSSSQSDRGLYEEFLEPTIDTDTGMLVWMGDY